MGLSEPAGSTLVLLCDTASAPGQMWVLGQEGGVPAGLGTLRLAGTSGTSTGHQGGLRGGSGGGWDAPLPSRLCALAPLSFWLASCVLLI